MRRPQNLTRLNKNEIEFIPWNFINIFSASFAPHYVYLKIIK